MELSEIISLVAAIISAPLSAWLTAVLLRRKYDAEVDGLRAQVEASKTDTRGDELDNVKKAMAILMEQVVEPLKKEIYAIRKELERFAGLLKKSIPALTLILLVLYVTSCGGLKNAKGTPANPPANIATERLVPVYLSPDSALLTALFECDSSNQVVMKAYNELKKCWGLKAAFLLITGSWTTRRMPSMTRFIYRQRILLFTCLNMCPVKRSISTGLHGGNRLKFTFADCLRLSF